MIAAVHDLLRQILAFGIGSVLAALFAVGMFFALSLLLVPFAALRKGAPRDDPSAERNTTEE